jgi:hypothetical protein
MFAARKKLDMGYAQGSSDNWEENARGRDARRSRIEKIVNDQDDTYFKCHDCHKFLESWMESTEQLDTCLECVDSQKEVQDVQE